MSDIVGIDFNGVVIYGVPGHRSKPTPMVLIPGVREALMTLKAEGYKLLLWTRLNNLSHRVDPRLNPLIANGSEPWPDDFNPQMSEFLFQRVIQFCEQQLPGIFDAYDDGRQGKAEMNFVIDDSAITFRSWPQAVAELRQMKKTKDAIKAAEDRRQKQLGRKDA